ncbi:AraC family transcriptional regulator [Puniceicoccus vermicola]|uniref:Helix-turn-helix transcriptional regulator n=1 Tax=Puniceicoccus vermicola TaxID=388746 RepID=A0A7X1E4M3_9BACT|nr:AraC family transcriptional regulator [Puniceicoccus vermicola]MBC2602690.1 helix-turn-helix transcriptional regulator [Puniceicoccus vermicola]
MSDDALAVWDSVIRDYGFESKGSHYAGHSYLIHQSSFGVGAEFQFPSEDYRWNGMERGGSETNRWFTFQWTLEGEGELRVEDKVFAQGPGQAFLVPIPSEHEYRVSPSGNGWKFFYLFLKDTHWVVDRLTRAVSDWVYTFPVEGGSRFQSETLRVIELMFSGHLDDPFEAEKAALCWMLEVERHLYQLKHPEDPRKELLFIADKFYRENQQRSFGVEDFAQVLGMGRAQASMHFKQITGISPAAYFNELRLKDAISLLRQGFKLQYIARETGFADANHLCKVFRRVYHMSPGQFKKIHAINRVLEVDDVADRLITDRQ